MNFFFVFWSWRSKIVDLYMFFFLCSGVSVFVCFGNTKTEEEKKNKGEKTPRITFTSHHHISLFLSFFSLYLSFSLPISHRFPFLFFSPLGAFWASKGCVFLLFLWVLLWPGGDLERRRKRKGSSYLDDPIVGFGGWLSIFSPGVASAF